MESFIYLSPVGLIKISANTNAIYEVQFLNAESEKNGQLVDLKNLKCDSKIKENLTVCINWLDAYFKGSFTELMFQEKLPVIDTTSQSEFASKVWNYLQTIPPGKTVTYGNVASAIGNSKSARAVGQVMKRNKLSILQPCHRVVCSNGSIGHYSSCNGTETKLWLLKHEEKNKELL